MGLPDTKTLDLELADEWLTVWLNEPEIRNPLTTARSNDLRALCAALQDRRDIRGVTFRGRGGQFCAGGDLKAFQKLFQDGVHADIVQMSLGAATLFDEIDALPQFTIMAVEGSALAGGFGLVCVGDLVIAEAQSRFALTETQIGLLPAQIAPFVLQRLGPRAGRRLMLTGAMLDAASALDAGLVDQVAEGHVGIDAAIDATRSQIRRAAPGALAATKSMIRALPSLDRAGQAAMAADRFADAMLSDEGREGVSSFVQKRKPKWAET